MAAIKKAAKAKSKTKAKKNAAKCTIRRNGETKTLYGAAASKVLAQRKAKGKVAAKRNAAKPAKKKAAKQNAAAFTKSTPAAVKSHKRAASPNRKQAAFVGKYYRALPGGRPPSLAELKKLKSLAASKNPDARALKLADAEAKRIATETAYYKRMLANGSRSDKEYAKGALTALERQAKGVARLRERASKNPRYLVEGDGRELGILVADNATKATARAKTIYKGVKKFKATKVAQQDFIGGRALAAKARAQQAKKTVKKAASKKTVKRNPEAGELYELFTGAPSTGFDLVSAPNGAPANVDQLGQFLRFKWVDWDGKKYSVELEKNGIPALLGVSRNKEGSDTLYALGDFVLDMPPGDHGYIVRIEYRAQKLHLGDDAPRVYYHDLGEETGEPPVLRVDKEGRLIFRDGAYWIEDRGIVN